MSEQQEHELAGAIAAVTANPGDDSSWDYIESLAGSLDDPDSVARAYRDALHQELDAELAVHVGQRAARFHEEWFGDDPRGLAKLLERVLALDPKSEWAFQQLTVVLTVAERWDDVLALYDGLLDSTTNKTRRLKLLDEAYQVAKDLADRPNRAIDYLKAKQEIKPSKKQLVALERLLERHERWSDLIALWREQLAEQREDERPSTLVRIAEYWFDKLGDGARALDAIRELLAQGSEGANQSACDLLERIATAQSIDAGLRDNALSTVREHYSATGREKEIVRVLGEILPLSDDSQRKGLHAELGERLSAMDEHAAALDHYAALLLLDPTSVATQRALLRETQLTDRFDRYANALASAAETCRDTTRRVELLSDAASVKLERVDDEDGAIDLLQTALSSPGISAADTLAVGRRLNVLLERGHRHSERLGVLERLADAETVESSRRALIGDVAGLAEELGEVDRALSAWRRRLEVDAGDLRALEAMVQLLEREKRWPDLIDALSHRVAQDIPSNQKRTDLVRIATVYETELGDRQRALESWLRIRDEFGDDPSIIAALSRLMSALEQWTELANLLEVSNERQVSYLADQLASLGGAYLQSIGDERKAIECYRKSLTVNARHEGARRGLSALLEREGSRSAAAEALVHSYRASGELLGLLDLVDARLAGTQDSRKHTEILREAADIAQSEAQDLPRAFGYVARLFPLTPRDQVLEDRLVSLAESTGSWPETFAALDAAEEALGDDSYAITQLRFRHAVLAETHDPDLEHAFSLLLQVIAAQPGLGEAVEKTVRLASRAKRYDEMASALLGLASAQDALPDTLLDLAKESVADGDQGLDNLTAALLRATEDSNLGARHKAELFWRLACWQRDELGDAAVATRTLSRSTTLDRNRVDTYLALADLQRPTGGRALFATLQRLCEIDGNQLDHFVEAAELAVDSLERTEQDASLKALLARATGAWRGSAPAQSSRDSEELVAWSIEKLVELFIAGGAAQQAMDLLIDSSRLPFDQATSLGMRRRAAKIAAEVLGNADSAIEMYRAVLALAPHDLETLHALADLYQEQGRLPEVLALRRHELGIVDDDKRRLELRLNISALIDAIERRGGRLEMLRQNLEEAPGHGPSIDAVATHLDSISRHDELAALLIAQAKRLEGAGEVPRAAELWASAADISERRIGDIDQALNAYRKVATLAPTLDALDSLARLYIERGQSGAAVPWLEQALAFCEDSERPRFVKRLAESHLAAGHRDDAVACLTEATADPDVGAVELREMLADLHRDAGAWKKLANVLTAALPHMHDDDKVARAAREAADIYHGRLDTPAAAIPALEKALDLVPGDRHLQLMMAKSQGAAGNLDAARAMLEGLVNEFGRRRSKERAAVHVELAQICRAQARLEDAVSELELASKMDVGNSHILKALAELAREQGNLEQAERSLRALLLVVRRQPPGDDETEVGMSEVLFELHHIAAIRDEEEKAEELLESVFEAASASDAEVRRLRRTLVAHGEYELLLRALRARVELSKDDESKAQLLDYIADLLEGQLDDPAQALEARLQTLHLVPEDRGRHDTARVLAGQLGKVESYLKCLEELTTKLRREEESSRAGSLLMRAGQVAENELGNLAKARELYSQAEDCSDSPAEALFALARVCGAQGDTEEQTRALDDLTKLALAEGPIAAQADALYKLAELQVAQPDLVLRGVELLRKALEVEPRYRQAAGILRAAAQTSDNATEVLAEYEPVARQAGDKGLLLDFLERRASSSMATAEQVREAVDLATELGESDRAIKLLERAVYNARQSAEGIGAGVWAAIALARHYTRVDRLPVARDLVFEIAHLAHPQDVTHLGLELAQIASSKDDDLPLAAEVYEFLRQREPSNREIWGPLMTAHRRMGNGAALAAIVDATLPTLVEASERNQLRMEKARYLVDVDETTEATDVLRDALLEDPDHLEAADLLEDVLRKDGNQDGLADFLWQRFEEAKQRGNPTTVTAVARRLGILLDELQGDAVTVFRQALAIAPESQELLVAVLSRLDDSSDLYERAELSERLLELETAEAAGQLALDLADVRSSLGDVAGEQRALEIGQRKAPTHATIKDRLATLYRESHQWAPLARIKINEAEVVEPDAAVELLREAAGLYRDYLSDLDTAAAVLRRAFEINATPSVASDLAACLALAGRHEHAVSFLSEALERFAGIDRLNLLLLRSDLQASLGDVAGSIADLEDALPLDREQVEPLLRSAVARQRLSAQDSGDFDVERSATMRLIELADAAGEEDAARALLVEWTRRDPQDLGALRRLRDMDTRAQRWEGVVAACSHLLQLEEGQEQVDAALRVADAASQIGAFEEGRAALEYVHRSQPQATDIRARLRELYSEMSAHRELANLLLVDAECCDDDEQRYDKLRSAADIFVNQLGDAEAAVAPAQKARDLKPDDHTTVVLLADVLVASSQIGEAVAMLEPAIANHKRRSPELATLQHRMAKAAAAQGDREAQLDWLKKAFDVDRKDGVIASELAHLATEMGDYELALKPLRAITLMDTPGPVSRVMALLWEAKIEHARGNRAKAELWAKKALREDPAYQEAEEFLQQISE